MVLGQGIVPFKGRVLGALTVKGFNVKGLSRYGHALYVLDTVVVLGCESTC